MKKRWLSLLLVLTMVLGLMVPVSVGAADTAVPTEQMSGQVINPLYDGLPAPEQQEEAEEQSAEDAVADAKEATYVSSTQAADQLRQAMVARKSSVTLYIETSDFWYFDGQSNWFSSDFFPVVYSMELAQCPFDGDYLKWSWYQYRWSLENQSGNRYQFYIELYYYSTASQEQWMANEIPWVVDNLGVRSMSDYDAYTTLYDYVTSHVEYDYEGLDNGDPGVYTAYAALYKGTAVCQGYATLYYALCWEAGLPVRIITSYNHAWNIVYLKGVWYYVDSTWDSESYTGRDWYLLGQNNFSGDPSHVNEDEYLTAEFQSKYPISPWDYDPNMPYNDVPKSNGAYNYILEATEMGLFNGTTTYTFSPNLEIERGMLVTVLWRLEGCPKATKDSGFTDVPKNMYYVEAVNWAAENGIVNGMGDNKFEPAGKATREQLVTVLYRYAKYLKKDTSASASLSKFTDASRVGAYAQEAMQWAVGSGLVNGVTPTTLCPQNNTPREQLATLLVRLIDYYDLAV